MTDAEPVSANFGVDRGTPIDRVFIETFFASRARWVHGRVLEVGDDRYARRFGPPDIVAEILDVDPDNGSATLVADLAVPGALAERRYDCAVVTQVLQYVADPSVAVHSLYDCLVPGGALLVTAPGITRLDPGAGRRLDRWRFTSQGLTDLLRCAFSADAVETMGFGDLPTAIAFLRGSAAEEIGLTVGDTRSSDFPVVVCALAVRW